MIVSISPVIGPRRNGPQGVRLGFSAKGVRFFSVVLLSLTLGIPGESSTLRSLRPVVFEGRSGFGLANDKLEVVILIRGGSLASLVLRDDPEQLNPLWNPVRMAREAGQQPPAHPHFGHFVCVDGFGPGSVEEQAAGLPYHGEARTQRWKLRFARKQGDTLTLQFSTLLPRVLQRFTRTFRLVDGENVIYIESELENLLAFDRPICWAEHVTIASPFLESGKTRVDLSARRCQTRAYLPEEEAPPPRLASGREFIWPLAPGVDGKLIDLRMAAASLSMDHATCVMDRVGRYAFVTALHVEKRLVLGYIFRPEDYPWLQDWQDYSTPGQSVRGLEFATQPFDMSRREAVRMGALFDVPTYRWLPARSKIRTSFLLFYARVPEGFRRVDDVWLGEGQIVLQDREAGKRVVLAASRKL